jgi:diguanylate cyclase (GGDEF)-like protein
MTSSISSYIFKPIRWAVFGTVQFSESEEYQEFRYKFLIINMLIAALLTGLFILGTMSQINPIGWHHGWSMLGFTSGTILLWLVLRNHPKRFYSVGMVYEILTLWECTSSLLYVPTDELRILWFYTNIPCVFILLGQRVGWIVMAISAIGFLVINEHLSRPYSPNAVATGFLAFAYFGVIFHAYVDRSISYFKRMRDYNAKLHDMASHDSLTQVLNAGAYFRTCDQAIHAAQRSNQEFSILFIDLDHFKQVNDTYGHAVGDDVLIAAASAIQNGVRQSDIVGRIGGEEFSVFLPNTSLEGAQQLAELIRQSIEQLVIRHEDQPIKVTASLGVATQTLGHESIHAIQQHADQAMYEAKRNGRNRVSTFNTQHLAIG